jgi:hypothetical protein
MKTSVVRLTLSGNLKARRMFIGLAALAILCTALAQIGAENLEERMEHGKRTLHVMDYGYALPIEITSIRNFHRAHWLRDLEIELKNISTKPIYEVYFTLFLPDDRDATGASYGVSLQYGRFHLIHPSTLPSTEDKPIWPGETAVVKVHEQLSRGYERHLRIGNIQKAQSYRVRMAVLAINFGDGTGFVNGGVPYPRNRIASKPRSRYVRIPIESNQQSLHFQVVTRPPSMPSCRITQLRNRSNLSVSAVPVRATATTRTTRINCTATRPELRTVVISQA